MSKALLVTVVNVGYRSTNYWVVSAGRSRVLVDLVLFGYSAEHQLLGIAGS
jgi:hypothetical protein